MKRPVPNIVTIDGPAGAGKSTVAKALALRLGYAYCDTGAMYRALTLKALRRGVHLESEDELAALAAETRIELDGKPDGLRILLDGEDVTAEIRSPDVTNATFYVARAPKVRGVMVGWQRQIGCRRDIVIEGRDVGTVVFPGAGLKFFLDADFGERSSRRLNEFRQTGQTVDATQLAQELRERDHKDITRTVGPLKKADDAVLIDSTDLTVEQVVEQMMALITKVNRER